MQAARRASMRLYLLCPCEKFHNGFFLGEGNCGAIQSAIDIVGPDEKGGIAPEHTAGLRQRK